jgi:hypothetical protein
MSKGNPALGQIVRGQLQGDFVTSQDTDAIPAQSAGQVGQNHPFMFQLDAEKAAWKFF